MEITPELIKDALARPSDFGWHGDEKMFDTWGLCGPVYTRDSGPLEVSNYDLIFQDLVARFGAEVESIQMGHWAHGWIRQIAVRVIEDIPPMGNRAHLAGVTDEEWRDRNLKPTEAFEALMEWREFLQDNPIADEEHAERTRVSMEGEYE